MFKIVIVADSASLQDWLAAASSRLERCPPCAIAPVKGLAGNSVAVSEDDAHDFPWWAQKLPGWRGRPAYVETPDGTRATHSVRISPGYVITEGRMKR